MSKLGQYAWLEREPSPAMLLAALPLFGTEETVGEADNPVILQWAKECGIKGYNHDSIAWCGLFIALVAKRAGKPIPENPLWARNWAAWGVASNKELGAVLVFMRAGGGHVGLYVGEDSDCYHVLGGNQSDSVCITRIRKERLIACRSLYKIKPDNVRPIWLSSVGFVSANEL